MAAPDRLRAFALDVLHRFFDVWELHDDALLALADEPDPAAWKPWREVTDAVDDQWFVWRDPDAPGDLHVDQVATDGAGRIEAKQGCGLDVYPECQPLRFAEDVREVLAKEATV